MEPHPLLRSPWFDVVQRGPVVEVARTELGFDTVSDVDRAHLELVRTLDRLPRASLAIVVDLRLAPPRNDPEFEQAMLRHRDRLFESFARRAVIVRSAVGRLNVQRHARTDGHRDLHVFTEPGEALDYARGN